MNKDMLDRLRSAVREGSRKSAEPRPDKAAVPMTTLVSTPSEAEDRIGPSFYSQADLDAARRAAEQLGYGIGLKPARAKETARRHSARRREQGLGPHTRNRPVAGPRRSFRPQVRRRPRRGLPDRTRRFETGCGP